MATRCYGVPARQLLGQRAADPADEQGHGPEVRDPVLRHGQSESRQVFPGVVGQWCHRSPGIHGYRQSNGPGYPARALQRQRPGPDRPGQRQREFHVFRFVQQRHAFHSERPGPGAGGHVGKAVGQLAGRAQPERSGAWPEGVRCGHLASPDRAQGHRPRHPGQAGPACGSRAPS
ncbi:hypothetical protein G6F57_020766 [Rhizopus arrhizus]|nr:hypothetical protein G6F57_020766 [Rhizopus arrhizus]